MNEQSDEQSDYNPIKVLKFYKFFTTKIFDVMEKNL